jgi:hypothetical protein
MRAPASSRGRRFPGQRVNLDPARGDEALLATEVVDDQRGRAAF